MRALLRLKFATDALEESYARLRELEKVRDDLMKMIVHDLKTPLDVVLATLEMVLDNDFGALTEPQARALGDAEARAEELLALIEDLLEVARIEEHTHHAATASRSRRRRCSRRSSTNGALRFKQEGATATVEVADDAPVFRADKVLLKRVLSQPRAERDDATAGRGARSRSRAEPDASGMLDHRRRRWPRHSERIPGNHFPEVRARARGERAACAKLGVGAHLLPLAVESHGGRIWVKSADGEGSTFYVQMPIVPTETPRAMNRTGEFIAPGAVRA